MPISRFQAHHNPKYLKDIPLRRGVRPGERVGVTNLALIDDLKKAKIQPGTDRVYTGTHLEQLRKQLSEKPRSATEAPRVPKPSRHTQS